MNIVQWLFEKRVPWKGDPPSLRILRIVVILGATALLAYLAYLYFLG